MRHFIIILTISSLLFSCGENSNKQKELELKEKELTLKEKELYLDSIQKSKKVEPTTSNNVNPTSLPSKDIAEKSTPTQNTGDKDKFIGTFTWSGECPRGCSYTHIFKQNSTVKTTFETAQGSETTSENWTVDENKKIIKMGKEKWYYKFINDKIKLTSCQYPLDTHELTREKLV